MFELAKWEAFWILHSRFYVTADHSALGRGLPTEALLKEDLAVDACDLYGLGNVQCQGGEKLRFPRRITRPSIPCEELNFNALGAFYATGATILRAVKSLIQGRQLSDLFL